MAGPINEAAVGGHTKDSLDLLPPGTLNSAIYLLGFCVQRLHHLANDVEPHVLLDANVAARYDSYVCAIDNCLARLGKKTGKANKNKRRLLAEVESNVRDLALIWTALQDAGSKCQQDDFGPLKPHIVRSQGACQKLLAQAWSVAKLAPQGGRILPVGLALADCLFHAGRTNVACVRSGGVAALDQALQACRAAHIPADVPQPLAELQGMVGSSTASTPTAAPWEFVCGAHSHIRDFLDGTSQYNRPAKRGRPAIDIDPRKQKLYEDLKATHMTRAEFGRERGIPVDELKAACDHVRHHMVRKPRRQ